MSFSLFLSFFSSTLLLSLSLTLSLFSFYWFCLIQLHSVSGNSSGWLSVGWNHIYYCLCRHPNTHTHTFLFSVFSTVLAPGHGYCKMLFEWGTLWAAIVCQGSVMESIFSLSGLLGPVTGTVLVTYYRWLRLEFIHWLNPQDRREWKKDFWKTLTSLVVDTFFQTICKEIHTLGSQYFIEFKPRTMQFLSAACAAVLCIVSLS